MEGFERVAETLAAVPILLQRVAALEERNAYMERLLVKNWFRRAEAKQILNMSDPKLNEIANDEAEFVKGKIRRQYEGAKPIYSREDIEAYLVFRKHKSVSDARARVIQAVA